jgi:NitT/TauT family transport system ATP-binding protein
MTRSLMQEHLAEMMSQMTRTTLFITTDIDEAILLADRIVVMAYRPTRVSAIIDVDLPHPRRMSTIFANDAANAIKARALEVLHAEAAQAFRRFRS